MTQPTRILILDDHEIVRKGLRMFLDHEPDLLVVGEAGSLTDALGLVGRLRPHLVLLDMKLSDTSGIEACGRLLAVAPQLRVLILTSYDEETMVAAAIKSGAHGYILKDVKMEDLVHAIRTVAEGRDYLDPRITQHAFRWIRASVTREALNRGMGSLSPQERLIMPLLAQGKTNKEIANQLQLSDKTIKNYLANIYDKLGVNRRTEAVAWFMREHPSPYIAHSS